ncbi:uncharacterized protein LOC132189887 isoform X2 [Corylus avellana]|uniref:uncharacterized protein LOC132189887 isoform X2 n=1 Tax=Corylus avellana TaxID=13451 RepID=UPI00286A26C6|nr:uncharacterized protein LOC132189887 isoform X2 [Corylus avellana]
MLYIIYDPVCLPHLVRVLAILLNQNKSMDGKVNGINQWNADDNSDGFDSKVNGANQGNPNADCDGFDKNPTSNSGSREGHMAYIAFIIRNTNTFNQFLSLVGQANFTITDLTETHKLMPFPFPLYDLLEQSLPLYNMLRCHVKQTSCLLKSPLPPPDLPVPANEKLLAWVGDKILPCDSGKIKKAIFSTLIRCGMFDNAHIRLSLTCGKKVTSGMNPAFNLYGCTLIGSPRDQGSQPPQMVFWVGNSLEF